MSLEQAVKDLQAQNVQLMTLINHLAKGQEEIKELITNRDKKRSEKSPKAEEDFNVVHGQKRGNYNQPVGAVLIPTPLPQQQRKLGTHKRQFPKIYMSLAQALQYLLKAKLIALKDPPVNPNTASHQYNPNARCAYHSNSPGHDTNDCWALKNKIQDMIDAGEIKFEPPRTPHVITAPMPNHA